jgi:hypothetical protein
MSYMDSSVCNDRRHLTVRDTVLNPVCLNGWNGDTSQKTGQ